MTNIMMCTLLLLLSATFITTGVNLIVQWRKRLDTKYLTHKTFNHIRCWTGGILGFGDIILGLFAIVEAILIAIFGL